MKEVGISGDFLEWKSEREQAEYERRRGTPEGRLCAAMTRCGLVPDCDRSMDGLIYSMERQVQCLQERVKLQAEMIEHNRD